MSNIAGKAYAMNVITPIKWYTRWKNQLIFYAVGKWPFNQRLTGLVTLSLIHYARWTIIKPNQFPRLDPTQPKETTKYSYMLFFSNFNGSWDQYVDSFSMAIPAGLNLFWKDNVGYPGSVPIQPFHNYISYNQVWTNHYYNAYPLAAANDVKSAQKVKKELLAFMEESNDSSPEAFQVQYNKLLNSLQNQISLMAPSPIVSLSAQAVEDLYLAQNNTKKGA